jgi:serine protease inhibitor
MYKNTSVSVPEVPVEFHADRPFIYLITEKSTGAVLFAGRFGGK